MALCRSKHRQILRAGAWKRGQEPIAKWPKGCSALLVPDPFSKHLAIAGTALRLVRPTDSTHILCPDEAHSCAHGYPVAIAWRLLCRVGFVMAAKAENSDSTISHLKGLEKGSGTNSQMAQRVFHTIGS